MRKLIYDELKAQGRPVSAVELGSRFGLSLSTVGYHLLKLGSTEAVQCVSPESSDSALVRFYEVAGD
jgi:DNA-binding transcriptional ArsR family regulator